MFVKVVACLVLVASVQSGEIEDITKSMRKTLEWLSTQPQDKNSTIILAVAAGSVLKQESGIETEVQENYLELIISLVKEKLMNIDPEVRQYFDAKLWTFVGAFSPNNVAAQSVSPDSASAIYAESQPTQFYADCLSAFYAANTAPHHPPASCGISQACKDAMTNPASGVAVDLRNRFVMIAKQLGGCTDFDADYDLIIKGQMDILLGQINRFLVDVSNSALNAGYTYTFLRKVILMAISGYNSITTEVLDYVKKLVNADGSCNAGVVLCSQCYAIWAFRRQVLMHV